MTILEPTNAAQSFAVWPRNDSFNANTGTLTIVNENTNFVLNTGIVSAVNNNGYLEVSITTNAGELYESAYYILTMKNVNDDILFRGRVFCTAQEPKEYTINENEFVFAPPLDNQFIIL